MLLRKGGVVMTDRCADVVSRCRFMGGSVAVSIHGYGAQTLPVFILPEIGYDMEACLREANSLRWSRL